MAHHARLSTIGAHTVSRQTDQSATIVLTLSACARALQEEFRKGVAACIICEAMHSPRQIKAAGGHLILTSSGAKDGAEPSAPAATVVVEAPVSSLGSQVTAPASTVASPMHT